MPNDTEPLSDEERELLHLALGIDRLPSGPPLPPSPMTITQRLTMVAREIEAVEKSRSGDAGGGEHYRFRGIDDVTAAVHPLFAKWGIVLDYDDLSVEWEDVQRGRQGNVWRHYLVRVQWTFHGWDGDELTAENTGEGLDNSDKGLGKARSYALKDYLTRAFTIPVDDPNADNEAAMPPEREAEPGGIVAADAAAVAAGFEDAAHRRILHDEVSAFIQANVPADRRGELTAMRGGQWPVSMTLLSKIQDRANEIAAETDEEPTWDEAHDDAATSTTEPPTDEVASTLDATNGSPVEESPADERPGPPPLDDDTLAAANKTALADWCRMRGLRTSGSMSDLRLRLRQYQGDT